jgi:outer membrane protein TolC
MGLAPTAMVQLVPSLSEVAVESAGRPERHVKVRIARAGYTVAERALELEIRKQYPDLEIGGGFGRDEGDSRILGGISVPLPLLNGNRRGIAEAAARRDAVRSAFEQQLIATESAIARIDSERSAAREQLNQIENALVPLVDRQLLEARRLLEVGEFNPLLIREAIDSSAEARLEVLAARVSLAHTAAASAYWTELAVPTPVIKENP